MSQRTGFLNETANTISDFSPIARDADGNVDLLYSTLLVGFLALNVADYAVTKVAITRGAVEANPLLNLLFKHEPAGFLLKNVFGTSFFNRQFKRLRRKGGKTYSYLVLGGCIALFGWTVKHNIDIMCSPDKPEKS